MAVGPALATAFIRIRPETSGFGRELDEKVRKEADGQRTGEKIGRDLGNGISRGLSPMLTAAVGLGPALVPALAAGTAAAGGFGVALASGGAALGVFGAVAKASFKDIQDNLKLAKKGTEDLTSPVGRATAAYQGLTSAWDKFVEHNQPQVFRAFGAGFGILTSAIPKLQPLFNVASDAVLRFEGDLGHFVSSGGLDRLVAFLRTNAGPALESFRQTFINLGTGIGALAPQFARFTGGVETGLVQLSAKFAAWAQNTGPSGGFQRFLDYVVATGPAIISTLHDLASAAVNIGKGLAPLGPVSLSFVGAMARLVSVLPPGFITGLAAGFVALQTALKITSALGLTFKTDVVDNLRLVFTEVPKGMRAAAAATTLFKGALTVGPIALVSLALSGLTALFVKHQQAVAESRAKAQELADTLDRETGAITASTRAQQVKNLEDAGALRAAQALGISLSVVTDAALGNKDAMDQINTAVTKVHGRYDSFIGTGQAMDKGLADQNQAASELTKALGDANGQLADGSAKQARMRAATQPTTVAITAQKQAALNAKAALEQLAEKLLKVAGQNLGVAQTELSFKSSLDSLSQSVHDNGKSLSDNTVKGRANRSAVLESISAALQHADAVGKQTGSQDKAAQAFQKSIPEIEKQATKLGLNKKAVDNLIGSIADLKPKNVDVGVTVRGTKVVFSDKGTVTGGGAGGAKAFAEGGIMPGYTPGRDVHDFYSATAGHLRLSGGEPVLRPEAGRVLGRGWVDGINASARSGGTRAVQRFLGGFANGGFIRAEDGSLVPASFYSKTAGSVLNGPGSSAATIPNFVNTAVNSAAVAAARAAVQALINSGRLTAALSAPFSGGGNVSRWTPVVLSVLAALHQPASLLGAVLRRIGFESGGNQFAINLSDSNARAGTPSQGLVQTIPATFAAFANGYRNRGITDPFANVYAGMNYALHRYGSIAAIDPLVRPRGYRDGLDYVPYDGFPAVLHRGERVLTAQQNAGTPGGQMVSLADLKATMLGLRFSVEGDTARFVAADLARFAARGKSS